MRSSIISAAVLAFASSVFAQTAGFDAITVPTQDQQVPANTTLDITWTPTPGYDNDTVSITLLYGTSASTLQLASDNIASKIPNYLGTYAYVVPSENLYPTYGFKISLDFNTAIFQYSFPFHVTGGSSSSLTGTATSTVTQTLATGSAYSSSASVVTVTNSSSIATTTASSTFASATSNLTTSAIVKTTTAGTKTASSSSSSTASASATKSSSAAVGNSVTGGLAAFGGLVLAFAL